MSDRRHFRCTACQRINRIPADKLGKKPRCGHCGTALDTSGVPIHVNDAELETLLRTSPVPVLVDFYADWCGPCRTLGPVLEQLGRDLAGRLVVAKVDTDRDGQHAARLGVRSIPAVHLFANGAPVADQIGTQPLPFWHRFVAPYLA